MSKKPTPKPTTLTGSCLCHAVTYTLTGTPRGPVLCHCINCQKITGSAFANNLRYTKARLSLTTGAEKIKRYEDGATLTGNKLSRYFCGECGSPIYLTNPAFEGLVVLYSGGVDGGGGEGEAEKNAKPKGEILAENRRGWFGGVEGAAKL